MNSDVATLRVDFHSMPIAAMRISARHVVSVNRAYETLTGIDVAKLVGRHVSDLIDAFVVADDANVIHGMMGDGASRNVPQGDLWCRLTDSDNVTRTMRVLWRPAPDQQTRDDHVVFLIPADTDASERLFAQRLTYAAAGLLRCTDERTVLERAADALADDGYTVTFLLLRDDDAFLTYGPTRSPRAVSSAALFEAERPSRDVLERFNPGFYQRRAAFFQHPADLVRDAFPESVATPLTASLPGRRLVQAPIFVADVPYGAMVVTDDRLTHVSVGTLEMYAQLVGAAVENVRGHVRDNARLEQLQQLQGELLRSERLAALGEAAAVMAHEVRNPIAAILNASTLLERGDRSTATDAELRTMIAEEAARLERMVSDLLALGRPLTPRIREVDLGEIVDEAVGMLRVRRELRDCVVECVLREALSAAVDPDLIELAVLNVVRNAVQASPAAGRVRVTVRRDGADRVALDVEDEGPGLTDEVAARMLEPFFTTRATGTGIGLAVARRVLDANRGSFTAGRSEFGGACVTLLLPAWRG